MTIVEFKRRHLDRLRLQPAQAQLGVPFDTADIITGTAITGLEDGEIVFCGGTYRRVMEREPFTVLWAGLALEARHHLFMISRCAQRFIELSDYPVIMGVQPDFPQAVRWAKMLGFELVHPDKPLSLYMRKK